MHDVARPGRGRKPRLVHEEDVFWGHDGTYVDIEGTQDIRQAAMEERGERKPEFVAPGAEQKWRARNLVDIHWALTAIKTPSESYNRVLSCIIDHANPITVCAIRANPSSPLKRDTASRPSSVQSAGGRNKDSSRPKAVASVMRLPTTRNGTCWKVFGWASCLTLRSKKRRGSLRGPTT
jgi:hypothetical protein